MTKYIPVEKRLLICGPGTDVYITRRRRKWPPKFNAYGIMVVNHITTHMTRPHVPSTETTEVCASIGPHSENLGRLWEELA